MFDFNCSNCFYEINQQIILLLIDYVPACGEVQVASVDQGIAPKTNSEKTKVKIHKQKNNIYPYFYY